MKNRVTELLGIDYPLIQAGMIWCSGWKLAAAVSNSGCLGVIGSGSMYPDILREHIQKCKAATKNPFAVNVPLLYPNIEEHIKIIIEEKVPIVITSAGNPGIYTPILKQNCIKVIHVISNVKFALKAENCGVDAVVAEGFEAGGHNGREETTTLVLIPHVCQELKIPVIAAGGIGSGKSMLAAMVLGAEGVQIGSKFVATQESSAHENFKQAVVNAKEGDTQLSLKKLTPVRLLKNEFFQTVEQAELRGASPEELAEILGRARAKKGMFEGDLKEGELEIGQISGYINEILPASKVIDEILNEFSASLKQIGNLSLQ